DFVGWFTDQTNGTQIDANTVVNANVTYYAHWTPKQYTVTYNVNGGDTLSQTTKAVIYGSTYGELPVPTRTGHTFAGWYTEITGGTPITATTTVTITAAQTIYAHWIANQYTVTYNVNGGNTLTTKTKTVTYGAAYGTLATPTRTGHTFAGWYTAATGGTQITAATPVTITAAQTIYAHWTVNQYTVTYNVNGGNTLTTKTKTVTYGGVYGTLTTPTRTGHTFAGWYTLATGGTQITAGTMVTITADQTIYAHWTPIPSSPSVTIQFDANGGINVAARTIEQGTAIGSLPVTTRTGYTFTGWYTASSGGSQISAYTTVNADATYYAHWIANQYTVTYDVNGGNTLTTKTKTVTYGAAYGTLATPTRTGHTFAGWYTAATGGTQITAATPVTITAAQTIYAHWTGISVQGVLNSAQTQIALTASNMQFLSGVSKVQFAVWGNAGGQNDLKWYTANKSGTSTYQLPILVSNHKETGVYNIHAYATLTNGARVFVGATSVTVSAPKGTMTPQSVNTGNGTFRVKFSVSSAPSGVTEVQIPVWSASNQNDLYWYKATKQADGSYIADVNIKNHKYNYGTYTAHCYVRGGNGTYVAVASKSIPFPAPTVSVMAYLNSTQTQISMTASNVIRLPGVSKVQFAVWGSAGGQNDLKWYTANKSGTSIYQLPILVSNHKETGVYNIHAYATLTNGARIFVGATTVAVTA
ncbi:MAG: InlB B-repeat-containing protein, partial [Clostridiales Family XIII bacterium]|nr:InlB B-repeat-containing protein [Clostridiales Family XIII bacterium]